MIFFFFKVTTQMSEKYELSALSIWGCLKWFNIGNFTSYFSLVFQIQKNETKKIPQKSEQQDKKSII